VQIIYSERLCFRAAGCRGAGRWLAVMSPTRGLAGFLVAVSARSVLRFWHLQGRTGGPLDQAVPKAANRRPGLPRPLEQGQVAALLASCDQLTAAGQRDLALAEERRGL
jgi:hypothetical protein